MGSVPFGRAAGMMILVLVLAGPLVGMGVHRVLAVGEDARTERRFDRVVDEAAFRLESHRRAYAEVLSAVAAFFESSEYVSRDEFALFTRDALARHRGLRSIDWVPAVRPDELADLEARARAEGLDDYAVRPFSPDAPAPGAHHPILYSAPAGAARGAGGLDLATDPVRAEALVRARALDGPAFSAPVTLVGPAGAETGVMAFRRVGVDRGAVRLVFTAGSMVDTSPCETLGHGPDCFDFTLEDVTPDGRGGVLLRHGADPSAPEAIRWRETRTLEAGGRTWRLVASPTAPFLAADRRLAGAAGVGAAVLWELFWLTAVLFAGLARARLLRGRDRLTRSVLRGMSEGVLVAGADGRIVLANTAAEPWLTRRPDGSFAPPTFYHPDAITPCEPAEDPLARAAAGERVRDEIFCLHDGAASTTYWLTLNGAPLPAEDGGGGLLVLRDITDRKRSDEIVEKLFNAVEHTDDAVFITNRKGRIEYVNPAFERVTGYGREEAVGSTPKLLKSGRHGPEYYKELWDTVLSGKVYRNTVSNRKKTGEIFVADQTITPMRDLTGRISNFVSVIKDLTEVLALQERELSLRVAAKVQQRLYPDAPPRVAGFDLAGAVFSAEETSGDYYDYLEMPDGGLGVAVGDVSGHGIGAAMVMMETRALLRSMVEAGVPLEEVFARLNRYLYDDLDPGSFVTLIAAAVRPGTGRLAYLSAGHETCWVLDARGRLKAELPSTGLPLGLVQGSAARLKLGPELEEGDVAVFLTDGLTECQARHGRFLETETCLDAVRARLDRPAGEIVAGLHALARDFSGDDPLTDDITIVVLKAGARASEDEAAAG